MTTEQHSADAQDIVERLSEATAEARDDWATEPICDMERSAGAIVALRKVGCQYSTGCVAYERALRETWGEANDFDWCARCRILDEEIAKAEKLMEAP